MPLANATPFAALAAPFVGPEGRDVVIAVVKATFRRGATGRLVVADQQAPVRVGDVARFPDAQDSSLRYPSDLCTGKRGTDIVIVGEAVSTRPIQSLDVAVHVGERQVCLRVHGERVYYRGAVGIAIGPAAPFERKALAWELAYGGTSPDKALVERRNPVGRGFGRSLAELIETPAPQMGVPRFPITSAADRPEPVGIGAIATHWSPRTELAGTLDELWRRTRMPHMPKDFDIRHNNVSPSELQFDPGLNAGDSIAVLGMTTEPLWKIELPELPVCIHARFDDGRLTTVRPAIDTVLVEPLKNTVEVVVRHAFRVGAAGPSCAIRVDADG